MGKNKIKIGIDCRCLNIPGGVKTYAKFLINNLIELDKENEYYLFYNDKSLLGTFKAENFHEVCVNFNKPNLYFLWDQVVLAWLCWKYNIDIIHGLKNTVPVFVKARRVVTIHDLIPVLFPKTMKWYHSIYWKIVFFIDSKIKAIIICNSNSTKNDFVKNYKTDNILTVVHLGVSVKDVERDADSAKEDVILYVGTLEPRKNIPNLINAFKYFSNEFAGYKLLLVGKSGWEDLQIDKTIKELHMESSVIKKGFVSEGELVRLYKTSKIFAYLSIYEGFGLPVLEAMSYGLPTVASANSSFFEISNNSNVLVDPNDVFQISDAFKKIISDREYSTTLEVKGKNNAQEFTWSECAKKTLQVYEGCK